jgi:hypothetical protein
MKEWSKKNPMKGFYVYKSIMSAKLKDSFRRKKFQLKAWKQKFIIRQTIIVKKKALIAIRKDKHRILVALRNYLYNLRKQLIYHHFHKLPRCSVAQAKKIARSLEK